MEEELRRKIAVVTTNMDVEYAAEILRGITGEAKDRGIDVYIFNPFVSSDETIKHNMGQYNIYSLVNLSLFDGVIVFSNLIQGRKIYNMVEKRLERTTIPVVGIDAPIGDHYCVGAENYNSMKKIVEHFIEFHGFTRIDYISGQSFNSDSRMRLEAYKDALKEHGIDVEERRIFPGTFTTQHGREVAQVILSSGEELPQAVVCGNDGIALGVCSVFREHGIRIPEQVAVSGFDNMFEARNSVPRLTTVDRALENVGREAVHKIADCLAGLNPEKTEVFPAVPIFAGSCGCKYRENDSVDFIRRKYLKMVDHYEKHLAQGNVMIEDLNDSKSYEDFLERLKHYVEELDCDRFCLCLNRKLVQELKQRREEGERPARMLGYTTKMVAALAYEFGGYVEYEDFPSAQMIPHIPVKETGNRALVFFPLNFRDVSQGYVVVQNCEFVLSSPLFKSWLLNLSNGLENLRKQTNLKRMLERLDKLYVTDSLTGLYNRFGFERYTKALFEECKEKCRPVMMFFADLDGLKKINDRYGHDKGDIAIRAVADSLQEICDGGEICARFGGDEYVAFGAYYSEEKAHIFSERFEKALQKYNEWINQSFAVSASHGYFIVVPAEGETMEQYIDRADKKMYQQKNLRHGER